MALTNLSQITTSGIATLTDINLNNITGVAATFTGNVTVGGTLTYDDVTNIDSVGLITARSGIIVATGTATTALVVNGDARITGILTVGSSSLTLDGTNNVVNVGTALTLGHTQGLQFHTQNLHSQGFEVNNVNATGIVTATTFIGNLTGTASNASGATSDFSIADKIIHTGDTNTAIRFPADDTVTVETGGWERLRISSTGLVGIGLTNPGDYYPQSDDLVVGTTSGNRGISVVSATTGTGSIVFADGVGNFENRRGQIVYDHSTDSLELFTDQTERLRVTSGGLVGIGTDNPDGQSTSANNLVIAEFGGEGGITIKNDANSMGHIFFADTDASAQGRIDYGHSGDYMRFYTANAERLRITSGGLVGIGTNNPGSPVDIANGDLEFSNKANSSVTQTIKFSDGTQGRGKIQYEHNGDSMVFHTFSSEKLRIDSTGDVRFAGTNLTNNTNKSVNLTAPSYNTSEEDVNLVQVENESGFNQISFGGGTSALNAATTLRFLTASTVNTTTGTERLRITSTGKVEIGSNGNYGNSPATLNIGSRASNIQGTVAIARGEAIGGGTGPMLSLVHGPDGGTQRTHQIYSFVGDLRIAADSNENMEFHTGGSESLRINASGDISMGKADDAVSWGAGVPTFEITGNSGSYPTRGGLIALESQSKVNGYGGMWLDNDTLSLYLGQARSSLQTPVERLRIAYSSADPYVGISTNGYFQDMRLPLSIRGQGFGHGWNQGGTTQDAIYLTAGASGNFTALTLTVDKYSWGSMCYEIHAHGYSGRYVHRVGGWYQNGSSFTQYGTTTYGDSNASFAFNAPASQQFTITLSGGNWTHPVAWLRLAHSGNGYLRYDNISFTWS
jgi:hypothetical protein